MSGVSLQDGLGVWIAPKAGLRIGLECGWHQRDLPGGHRVVCLCTFAPIGLLGGLLAVRGSTSTAAAAAMVTVDVDAITLSVGRVVGDGVVGVSVAGLEFFSRPPSTRSPSSGSCGCPTVDRWR